ncbi:MAG: DNA mismatch repair endonuclease MutL [Tuberibacillus sp.]
MGRIKRMDEKLANIIAAGEVVERPASIVKELVENALDAHATEIQVDVEEAGLRQIKITDNGDGFDPDDCEIAFERHATSKVLTENDLFHIRTLGFRGEALASIASVSHVELQTSTGDGPGKRIVLHGGVIAEKGAASARKGTELTVSNLFYNTPARLKHLKTIHTELAKITDIMNRLALSHPFVRFTLTHDGKVLLKTNGNGDTRQVLAAIYGVQTAQFSIPFQGQSLDFNIHGLLVKPELTRAGRQYVYLYINGRFIRHYGLFNAIIRGYHTLLPIGRYPIAVIYIEMDPTLVDVNVHPAKLEARISKENDLCDLLETAIREAFHKEQLIPMMEHKSKVIQPKSEQQAMDFSMPKPKVMDTQPLQAVEKKTEQPTAKYSTVRETSTFDQANVLSEMDRPATSIVITDEKPMDDSENTVAYGGQADEVQDNIEAPPAPKEEVHARRMPVMYPIGQLHGTYILAQNETGLYIIDQHAAQERIKYEFYREKVARTDHEIQELLLPLTFEFSQAEYAVIEQHREFLEGLGLSFEPFGSHTFLIRSHPIWLPKGREEEMIDTIIQCLLENKNVSVKELREDLAIMMSCKKSIKANRHLRMDEIEALLQDLAKASDPFTCPHGRPVIVHFTTYEMEKMFKRVM